MTNQLSSEHDPCWSMRRLQQSVPAARTMYETLRPPHSWADALGLYDRLRTDPPNLLPISFVLGEAAKKWTKYAERHHSTLGGQLTKMTRKRATALVIACNGRTNLPRLNAAAKFGTSVLQHPRFIEIFNEDYGAKILNIIQRMEDQRESYQLSIFDSGELIARLHTVERCTRALDLEIPELADVISLRHVSKALFQKAGTPFEGLGAHVLRRGDIVMQRLIAPVDLAWADLEHRTMSIRNGGTLIYALAIKGAHQYYLYFKREKDSERWTPDCSPIELANLVVNNLVGPVCSLAAAIPRTQLIGRERHEN